MILLAIYEEGDRALCQPAVLMHQAEEASDAS